MIQQTKISIDGPWWLGRAVRSIEPAASTCVPILRVPCGRTFDVVALPTTVGLAVVDALVERRTQVSPVLLDWISGMAQFVIAPCGADKFATLCARYHIGPGFGITHLSEGSRVCMPVSSATGGSALHWLIAPALRGVLLTRVDELLAVAAACIFPQQAAPTMSIQKESVT